MQTVETGIWTTNPLFINLPATLPTFGWCANGPSCFLGWINMDSVVNTWCFVSNLGMAEKATCERTSLETARQASAHCHCLHPLITHVSLFLENHRQSKRLHLLPPPASVGSRLSAGTSPYTCTQIQPPFRLSTWPTFTHTWLIADLQNLIKASRPSCFLQGSKFAYLSTRPSCCQGFPTAATQPPSQNTTLRGRAEGNAHALIGRGLRGSFVVQLSAARRPTKVQPSGTRVYLHLRRATKSAGEPTVMGVSSR